ncbi:hypothetical protein CK203_103622 [Vitis vinifera]|uniref:Uncharacterized protein n=1 Tax=Vitis vinifera TaxID=29760 RepID=A0A438BPY3_VITVI|nr:hypothetical protein CK203_103622 [Vitis vinifera]
MKRWHDQLISNKEFRKGQRVLLYDSRLHIFPGKLKSRWIGPFIIHQVHLNGVVELLNSNSTDTLKSMVIVSSHSLSHSSKKMRKSTSLSHRKPNQKRVRWTWRNCKEIEGRPQELKGAQKHENAWSAKFRSQNSPLRKWPLFRSPKETAAKSGLCCEIGPWLRKFSQLRKHLLAHECHLQPPTLILQL